MTHPIPLVNLSTLDPEFMARFNGCLKRIVESTEYIHGSDNRLFTKNLNQYLNTPFSLTLNSGTDALYIAMLSLGIGAGDEVITTPFTFIATAEAIFMTGAKPVFADIDPLTFNLNPEEIEKKITSRTKAILPVHLFGQMAQMEKILVIAHNRNLKVIEDAAQSFGALYNGKRAGTIGDIGCFSFYPTKNLGALGDGGALATSSSEAIEMATLLANHGSLDRTTYSVLGINSRLDNIQAAALNLKLPYLDAELALRREIALRYYQLLQGVDVVLPRELTQGTHSYNMYVIRAKNRERLQSHLTEAGIGSGTYYLKPLHLQPCFEYLGYKTGDFPEAERASRECLSIPMYPSLTEADQKRVVDVIKTST